MFDLNDNYDIVKFKKRLSEIRKSKGFTQDSFAESLDFSDRSRVANWESRASSTVPRLPDFTTVCNLLETDPNYLLGASDEISADDKAIADKTGLSCSNIRRLRSGKYTSDFINHLLSSSESENCIRRIEQVCYYKYISEAQESTFSAKALIKIKKVFEKFRREVFSLDMNVATFSKYIKDVFPWTPGKIPFYNFMNSIITENEYNNILFQEPEFESKSELEKYEILIYDIATASFDYMMSGLIVELAENEIAVTLNAIVKGFINSKVSNFKNRNLVQEMIGVCERGRTAGEVRAGPQSAPCA